MPVELRTPARGPRGTLDRIRWELAHERGPWASSKLYRLGQAVYAAAGAADDVDQAHELVWNALVSVGEHQSARVALERAGLDVAAIERALEPLEATHLQRRDDRQIELERRIAREIDAEHRGDALA